MIEKFSVGLGTFVPCLCYLFDFGLVLVFARIRYNLNPDTRPMTTRALYPRQMSAARGTIATHVWR